MGVNVGNTVLHKETLRNKRKVSTGHTQITHGRNPQATSAKGKSNPGDANKERHCIKTKTNTHTQPTTTPTPTPYTHTKQPSPCSQAVVEPPAREGEHADVAQAEETKWLQDKGSLHQLKPPLLRAWGEQEAEDGGE